MAASDPDAGIRSRHWHPAPGMVFVDAGSGPGTWAFEAAKAGAEVFAFDPKPLAARLLRQLFCGSDAEKNCRMVVMGLWDSCDYLPWGVNSFTDGCKKPLRYSPKGFEVTEVEEYLPVITLDRYFELHPISRLDCVNMDAEGAELRIVRGGFRVLSQFRPKLIIEVHECFGVNRQQLVDELVSLGYRTYDDEGFLIAEPAKPPQSWHDEDHTGLY